MIYVIKSGDYFKVGFSNNVRKRLIAYATHNPHFKLLKTFEGDKELESYLHCEFTSDNKHYRNEWFIYYSDVLTDLEEYVKRYYQFLKKVKDQVLTLEDFDNILFNSRYKIICTLQEFSDDLNSPSEEKMIEFINQVGTVPYRFNSVDGKVYWTFDFDNHIEIDFDTFKVN